jgi:hypothetical protein
MSRAQFDELCKQFVKTAQDFISDEELNVLALYSAQRAMIVTRSELADLAEVMVEGRNFLWFFQDGRG